MIFGVGLKVIDINSGETRNKQLQFLLSEDGDESLWNNLIESLQEGCQLLPDRTYRTNQSTLSRIVVSYCSSNLIWHKTQFGIFNSIVISVAVWNAAT